MNEEFGTLWEIRMEQSVVVVRVADASLLESVAVQSALSHYLMKLDCLDSIRFEVKAHKFN